MIKVVFNLFLVNTSLSLLKAGTVKTRKNCPCEVYIPVKSINNKL